MLLPHFYDIIEQYNDTRRAIKYYMACVLSGSVFVEKYSFRTEREINVIEQSLLNEHEHMSSFVLLTSIEAMLQQDYIIRVKKRKKDIISRAFRKKLHDVKRRKEARVLLGKDIFPVWRANLTGQELQCMIAVQNVFDYRHWLAHGRYWTLKIGAKPSFYDLSVLAQTLENVITTY